MESRYLYRAKGPDDGWIEGYYVKHVDTCACFSGDLKPENIHHLIIYDGFCDWGFEPPLMRADVDLSTLCQCTGLKDRSGNLIWENDIIRYNKTLYQIVWSNGCTHFIAHPFADDVGVRPCMTVGTMGCVEVVGNMFDNPELSESED